MSFLFYMTWGIKNITFLLFSIFSTYLGARWMGYCKNSFGKKLIMWLVLGSNLIILFMCKYYMFASSYLESICHRLNINIHMESFGIVAPLGISFYTLQVIGYMVDVCRKQIKPEKNLIRYALFVSFFHK